MAPSESSTSQPLSLQAQEQTLREYQTILENASVGILLTRDRKVLHCNRKTSEIFGWPDGELVGQSGSVFYLNDQDYAAFGQLAGPQLGRGELVNHEMAMQRKDGSPVYCHLRVKAINPDNPGEGTLWIVEDVGERRRMQSQMHELLLRQNAILENASVGISFTHNGLIVHANPAMELILGWGPGELVTHSASVFFQSEEDYGRFGQAVGPRLSLGELVDIEWRNRCKDGRLIWCRHLARSLPNLDGSHGSIWITEDIEEKKAAQEALLAAHGELERRILERTEALTRANARLTEEIAERRAFEDQLLASEERFRDLSSMSSDWFWEQDADFRFIEMSSGLAATALKPSSTIGKTRRELPVVGVSPEQWAAHQATLDARLPFQNFEYQMETQPGEVRWFSVSGAPIVKNGEFVGYRGTGKDITQQKRSEQQIEYLAYHDALTGLPNRVLLKDRMTQALAHADRTQTHVVLLFLDLDNFKQINDTLGHARGDLLLQHVAQRLTECVRESDTISRQGGDEFVIILTDLAHPEAATSVLVGIMNRLQEPIASEGQEISTSASIGVAVYPQDGGDFEMLSKHADMAMYKAKESGRNTFHYFDEAMNDDTSEHLAIRNGLRRAIEKSEFLLHYQPQFDLETGEVIGAEALLRWDHPQLGLVPPGKFIPIAEQSGHIVGIGDWVLQEACRQAVQWQQDGAPALSVAVNLSAVQFRRGDVEQTVRRALEQSGLSPGLLELELTESILIHNVDQVLATLHRLKGIGVKLSIDDFGTGYSSLSYLKRFDIDKLKIDQSFVRDLGQSSDDAAIVNAIIQMAHSLKLKTIAEGVETPAMLEQLRGFHCDEAQGYLFARPMPADAFAIFLSDQRAGRSTA